MSHAAPSCAGFAPRHSTFGVTTQKFDMGEPRSLAHPAGAAGIDEDGKPVRSANKKGNAGLQVLERNMSVHETRVVVDHATRAHHHLMSSNFTPRPARKLLRADSTRSRKRGSCSSLKSNQSSSDSKPIRTPAGLP